MGQALYRKYRSKSLDEIVGQENITKTLSNAIKTGRISHAYLFTGPRGVGKTSIARIFAHAINELSYNDESSHLDIIEIDAASNRRIDEIRDLRDKVYIAPAMAKYKVYIIDEVHMLTKEAFNALLKTLEEPPAHVIFILATTEAHKLPATIISRTQRYIFRPIEDAKVIGHLKEIAKLEKIKISEDALALIAEHGDGSFRDSISLLDQAGNHEGNISLETIQKMIGVAPETSISAIVEAVSSGDKLTIINQLSELNQQGYTPGQLAIQIGQKLRTQVITNSLKLAESVALELLSNLIEIPASSSPAQALEITLLKCTLPPQTTSQSTDLPVVKATVVEPVAAVKVQPVKRSDIKPVSLAEAEIEAETNLVHSGEPTSFNLKDWPKVLEQLKSKHNTLYSIAKLANPSIEDGQLELRFGFAFHQKRLIESKNNQIVKAIMAEITGKPVNFVCTVGKVDSKTTKIEAPSQQIEPISTVSNIFGGGEVLS